MVGLGPRVGGAHVDVSMKFDEKSLAQVGKAVKRQLSTLSKHLEAVGQQNARVYRGLGEGAVTAWRTFLGSVITGAPLIGGAISGIAGIATELAGSLYSLGQESGALLPIFTSLGIAGVTLKIGMRNFGAAVSEVDPKKLQLLLKGMPKSMQNAVMATRKLSDEMRAAVWPKLFVGLSDGINKLRNTGVIQKGLGQMADQLNGLARSVLNYANSKEGVKTIGTFFRNNAKVFGALSKIAVPFLDGFLRLVNALSPAAIRLAGNIEDVALKFQSWTKGEGFGKRVDDSMRKAATTAGKLWKILGNLGGAVMNVFNAANPSTNNFLDMIIDVTQRFQDWTKSVGGQNTIAKWAGAANDMMKQVGRTMEAIWPVLVKLADPAVMSSFLATLEGAFELLNKLPLKQMVDAFLQVSTALQPVSSFFLAVIIAGTSFSIMIGSLIGQMGGFFSIIAKAVRFKILITTLRNMGGGAGGAATKVGLLKRAWEIILKVFDRVKSALGKVLGFFGKTDAATAATAGRLGKLTNAFKPVLSILGRFAKIAGWVGIAVWVVTLIAKSKELQGKLGELWSSFKGVFGSLGDAFKEIGTALKPLAPVAEGAGKAFGFIFDMLDKIGTLIVGFALDTLIFGFKSLGQVIEGLGHIIAGLINFFVGLFTLDFSKMWDGIKQIGSGIIPLLKGLSGLLLSFFYPAKFLKLGFIAIKGLGAGMKAAMPAILSGIGRFLVFIGKGFLELVPRLISLGGQAIMGLGKAVVKYAPSVIAAAGRLVAGFLRWYLSLPGKIMNIGIRAIRGFGSAIARGAPKVLAAASRIVSGVVGWIGRLPGRLATLASRAVTGLANAFRRGISSMKTVAGNIVTSVVNTIRSLPGKLLRLGSSFASAGKKLGGKILSGIGDGIRAIGNMAGSIAGTLKSGINRAIGLPKTLGFNVLKKRISFTIPGFEKGGVTPGGLAVVGEGGPELASFPRGTRIHSNSDSKKMMDSGGRYALTITNWQTGQGYIEKIADDRINASDNLAFQGA